MPARSGLERSVRASSGFMSRLAAPSDPWTDLGLTLPVFLGYHLGVVFLDRLNAADFVTQNLILLAKHSLATYSGLTIGLGTVLVLVLMVLGRGKKLSWRRFGLVVLEGVAYATVMRTAARWVVGSLRLGPNSPSVGHLEGVVMSLGAGFYEELAFRVLLFGLGAWLIARLVPSRKLLAIVGWAVITSAAFSGWHYVYGEPFRLDSFVFRWICGLVFVLVYRFRGFAPVVWTHALYDIWVLAL
jgi:hypothetical protein